MKKLFLIAFALLLSGMAIHSAAQKNTLIRPSGQTVSKEIKASRITSIKVSGDIDVQLAQSDVTSVLVKTDRNALNYIVAEVTGDQLLLRYKNNTTVREVNTIVYVTAPEIRSIQATASADVYIKGILSVDRLNIEASSSADVKGTVKTGRLDIDATSSGEVEVAGSADICKVSASSSASVELNNFAGDELSIEASSSGDVEGDITYNSVAISASSSADIELTGEAASCRVNASSSADVDLEKLVCRTADVKASSSADVSVYVVESISGSASSGGRITYFGNPPHTNVENRSGGSVRSK